MVLGILCGRGRTHTCREGRSFRALCVRVVLLLAAGTEGGLERVDRGDAVCCPYGTLCFFIDSMFGYRCLTPCPMSFIWNSNGSKENKHRARVCCIVCVWFLPVIARLVHFPDVTGQTSFLAHAMMTRWNDGDDIMNSKQICTHVLYFALLQ